jgi:hypothetical protein
MIELADVAMIAMLGYIAVLCAALWLVLRR